MSANTWHLTFRDQETVKLTRDRRFVHFKITESPIITVDMLLGRASLHNPKSVGTLQKRLAFNRFFQLVSATRYVAENTDEGLVVKDKRSGAIISAHAKKVTVTIPTMSVMAIMRKFDCGVGARELVNDWINQYDQEAQDAKDAVSPPVSIPF